MTFTICFRTGGTANFKWTRTVAFATKREADLAAAEIRQGGRKALVYATGMLDAIGAPETFEGPTSARRDTLGAEMQQPKLVEACRRCRILSFLNDGLCLRCERKESSS